MARTFTVRTTLKGELDKVGVDLEALVEALSEGTLIHKVDTISVGGGHEGILITEEAPSSQITVNGKTSQFVAMGFTDTDSIHLDVVITTDPIAFMLVDLSNTAVWPHTNTDHVVLEYIILEVDPGSTFSGEVKIGYLKNVDADNGDIVTLVDIDMKRQSAVLLAPIDFGSHGIHCDDAHHFGPTDTNNTLFQTDAGALLGGPNDPGTGAYASGAGDLVLLVTGASTGNTSVDVSVTLGYETVA